MSELEKSLTNVATDRSCRNDVRLAAWDVLYFLESPVVPDLDFSKERYGYFRYEDHGGHVKRTKFVRFLSRRGMPCENTLLDEVGRAVCRAHDWGDLHIDGIMEVYGDEIAEVYAAFYGHHYHHGTLGSSCMAGPGLQDEYPGIFDLYTKNPDVVSLIAMDNPATGMAARAIVWKAANGEKFYDRVYYTCSTAEDYLIRWAEDQGYRSIGSLEVHLTGGIGDCVPYCDNMRYLSGCDGNYRLATSTPIDEPLCIILESTDGYKIYSACCCECGAWSTEGVDEYTGEDFVCESCV